MGKISIQYFKNEFGELILGSYGGGLCLCDWRNRKNRTTIDNRIQKGLQSVYEESDSETIETARLQLSEYFRGNRTSFDLPLILVGTDFQKKVWNELLKVSFGTTETYSGLARKLDNLPGIRAIASANGANALSIFVPCHRIVGMNGEMTGYAGGTSVKRKLLQMEGSCARQFTLFDQD